MAQQHASGGQLSEGALDGATERSTHQDSSTRVETFGVGVSATILLGALVGVAAAWALGGAVPLLVALGIGFIISPIVGIFALRRNE